jgi:signal transduction histidine kinase/CheY-like chemotaxis protein
MEENYLNRNLKRQVTKFLTEDDLINNPRLKDFINVVNQTYLNYEKDAELSEQASRLNDKEYTDINVKLKEELTEKEFFENKLIEAINKLSGDSIKRSYNSDIKELIEVLNNEIEVKKEYQELLYLAKASAEKANEAKSDFLSIMSHEIRTPLNAIIGLIYIMEKENTLASFRENLEVLKHSSNNLFLLINNILDFSKIEAGKIDIESIPFNFKDLIIQISKSLELKASENLNKISIEIDDDFTPYLISDPLRLGQIMTNLISNAIKFTKNGQIKVKVNQISLINDISTFKIQIIDNGIGIDIDKFNFIFEKFSQAETKTTRNYGGTGLGLVITKELLLLLNSEIQLKSEIGKGSNFYFILKLPVNNKKDHHDEIIFSSEYLEKDLNKMKVLLVEDNLINIKIAHKIISQWNVVVDVAENGLIAVEKFKDNNYDVILMDLSMPIMDGYEATAIIRNQDKKIPIIALTASASYGYLERAIKVGIDDYIIKPFSPKELNMKLFKYFK